MCYASNPACILRDYYVGHTCVDQTSQPLGDLRTTTGNSSATQEIPRLRRSHKAAIMVLYAVSDVGRKHLIITDRKF